jgi:hypothetical protein
MPTPASISSTPATRGPPKSAEIAEKDPAMASTGWCFSSTVTKRVTSRPTIEPRAIRGASGPRTAPKASVPTAANATPGA